MQGAPMTECDVWQTCCRFGTMALPWPGTHADRLMCAEGQCLSLWQGPFECALPFQGRALKLKPGFRLLQLACGMKDSVSLSAC